METQVGKQNFGEATLQHLETPMGEGGVQVSEWTLPCQKNSEKVVRNNFIDNTNKQLLLEKEKHNKEKLLSSKNQFFRCLKKLEYVQRLEKYSQCKTKTLEKYYGLEINKQCFEGSSNNINNNVIMVEIFEELTNRYKEDLKNAIS